MPFGRPIDLRAHRRSCIIATCIFRFVNEFWRVNPVVALGMTVPQWICLGVLAFVAGSLLARRLGWAGGRA